MTFDSRLRTQLETELESVPTASGDLDTVLARGHRRRISYRVAQMVAVAAAIAVAVASTALIVSLLSNGPRLVVSPITGEKLPVISEDPLVLQAQPGPAPTPAPEGTEMSLASIEELEPSEVDILNKESPGGTPIVALGESAGMRFYAVQASNLHLVITDPEEGSSWGLYDLVPQVVNGESAQFLVGQVSPDASHVVLTIGDNRQWQRPIEGVYVLVWQQPEYGAARALLRDSTGSVLFDELVGPAAGWVFLGLDQTDPAVWAGRVEEACTEGVWDHDVAVQLATEFINEDLAAGLEVSAIAPRSTEIAALYLWSMASHHCPDAFPPGQIKRVLNSPFEEFQAEVTPTTQPQISQAVIEVADAPIVGRYAHASAWTGEYVLIWGGIHKPSDLDPDLSDGARYDPTTNEWALLPPAPEGMSGPARSVWTGDRWIVRTDHVPDGPVQLASYDPAANEWTRLDTGPLGYGEGYLMVWTGDEVIFWGGHGGDVLNPSAPVAYNPATATWRELPSAPISTRTDPVAAWDGSELLVWEGTASCSGGDSTCVEFATDGAALDPADGSWRMLPAAPDVPPDTSTAGSVLIDNEFIVFLPVDCESGRCVAGIAYDPASDSWRSLPALGNMEWSFSAGPVAAGSEIYAWDRTGEGFSYSLRDDRWTDLGSYPMESRFSATVVAVGRQVFVWGGSSGSSTDDPFGDGFLTGP